MNIKSIDEIYNDLQTTIFNKTKGIDGNSKNIYKK